MDPKKHPNFKLIQKEWYRVLKKEGFDDAEEEVKGEILLKRYTLVRIRNNKRESTNQNNQRFDREAARAKYNYVFYTLCRQFLFTPELETIVKKNPKYRTIWEMYSEGVVYETIAKAVGMTARGIRAVIAKLIPIMMEAHARDDESNSD
jgi:ubiquinone/menaquinone biosynthesis C-methylase UbiE